MNLTSCHEWLKTHTLQPSTNQHDHHTKIAIIGGGPKGMYGLERLLASLQDSDANELLEIDFYNENEHFGAGNNYRIDQPEYLLINYSIGNINMWIDEQPLSNAKHTLSLLDWINYYKKDNERKAEEVHYASRALVGLYLQYGLAEMLKNLPSHVLVKLIIGSVSDILDQNDQYFLTLKDGMVTQAYDQLLLATGHSQIFNTEYEQACLSLAEAHPGTYFIPHAYPVNPTLTELPPNLKVAIKGMGLTFVDAALALTEGKGGKFIDREGHLNYERSGREPQIYAFSRGGLPMLPRGPLSKTTRYQTKYFTAGFVEKMRLRYPKGTLNFETELLPVIKQEYQYAYYSTWMKKYGYKCGDSASFKSFESDISSFRLQYQEIPAFNLDDFLSPLRGIRFANKESYHQYVIDYLEQAIKEAEIGEQNSPMMAAVAVWREITPLISSLYEFGGFTPASQKVFEELYYSRFSRVTFGPPIANIKKIVALAKASILNFSLGPSPIVSCDEESGKFHLKSSHPPFEIKVDGLVDARIAKPNLNNGTPEVYQNLLSRDMAVPFINQGYIPGCIHISQKGYLISSDGTINNKIALTGTPTEGVTLDNDTLSRTRNNFVSEWAYLTVQKLQQRTAYITK
ncbi:FAD/NAD(P)-binding protein [Anditalea andensis]|uniref:FAD/NAD(P)-binding protein n=1 Tax=Anditalea andensis TaxID=1048983 RepID=UPI0013DFE36D|nr:FAD/NAD(P)-binding protein [Anditalea andensis]